MSQIPVNQPYWLGQVPTAVNVTSNTATINNTTVNLIPVIVISTNSGTAALPTTATAAYTTTPTLLAGTYMITCEVYVVKPTGGWISTDNIGWSVGATTGATDNVTQFVQPFYLVGTTGTCNFNLVGLCIFSVESTLRVVPTYSITGGGVTYAINSLTYQKIG
jgi:hypothetical protein